MDLEGAAPPEEGAAVCSGVLSVCAVGVGCQGLKVVLHALPQMCACGVWLLTKHAALCVSPCCVSQHGSDPGCSS